MISSSDPTGPHGAGYRPDGDPSVEWRQTVRDDEPSTQAPPQRPGSLAGLSSAPRPTAGEARENSGVSGQPAKAIPTLIGTIDALSSQHQFMAEMQRALRASDVVPSLFGQYKVPSEIVERFAARYAFERQPNPRLLIPRGGYSTLAQIADRTQLNDHLGFRYGVFNVSLEFDGPANAYVEACNKRLVEQELSAFMVGTGIKPHQTLHQIALDMDRMDEFLHRFVEVAQDARIGQFEVRGLRHAVNDEGMVEIFYDQRKRWVAAANPVIAGLRDFAVMPVTTPPGRIIDDAFIDEQYARGNLDVLFNLKHAGFAEIPSVDEGGMGMPASQGSRFNPHSTYGKLWTPARMADSENDEVVSLMPPAVEGGGTLKYISVFEMGPHGTVIAEPLVRIPLLSK